MEEAPPIATAAAGAKLPEPSVEPAAPEPNPVDVKPAAAVEQAEQDAIKKRIAEMEGAENLQREVLTQQERYAKERQQHVAQIPEHIKRWADENPRYINDPIGQAELNVALMKATRDGLNWQSPNFVETVERHLGMRQQPAAKQPTTLPYEPPRQPAPRQAPVRQYKGPPISAPPTRDVPSYSTGKPSSYRSQLTGEESQLAASLGLSAEEYRHQKEKMLRLKDAGVLRDN
jgi:hypothetical protein